MHPIRALKVTFGLAAFGTVFSGALAYQELFGQTAMACPAPGAPGTVFGYPACVYGFFVFAMITVVTALGLRPDQRPDSADETAGDVASESPRVNAR